MKRLILLILVLSAVAAAQTTCTLSTITGTYAVSYLGWVYVAQPGGTLVALPGTVFGVISIGYDGKLSGGAAVSGMGPVVDFDISGTTEIKSDCTGTLHMKPKPRAGGPAGFETDRFVFIPSDKTLLTTIVDVDYGYPASNSVWKQMSTLPNAAAW